MKVFATISTLFILQGCTSHLYVHDPDSHIAQPKSLKPIVFVTNPDHRNNHILELSQIYELTSDSGASKRLTLLDGEKYTQCGNPIISAVLTLGFVPAYLEEPEEFRYSIEDSGVKKEYTHYLRLYERYSLWEWFFDPFAPEEDKVRAKALSVSKRQPSLAQINSRKSPLAAAGTFAAIDDTPP